MRIKYGMKKLSMRIKYFIYKAHSKITKYFIDKRKEDSLMNFVVLFIMVIVLFKFDKNNKD